MNKAVGVIAGLAAAVPLALAVPIIAISAQSSTSCVSGAAGSLDAKQVSDQVKRIVAGGKGGPVTVPGLLDPGAQVPIAKTIVATGVALHVPARGQVVALATALQESGLRNLSYGDRDSLGVFQQRPSQGWGSAQQILQPAYASTRFFRALISVHGWQSMTIAQAAQAVQKSGAPAAYAKWEPLATALQQAISPLLKDPGKDVPAVPAGSCGTGGDDGKGFGPIPAGSLPAGYKIPADAPGPVRTAIRFALGQLKTPYQWGGSCADAHGADPMGRCDCSSLMQAAYKAAGIRLPRTTYTQVHSGKAVSVKALKPGDLLFTEGSAAAPDHVGMYIGHGLIVHAPHTGDVVRITTLASWKSRILAARRIA